MLQLTEGLSSTVHQHGWGIFGSAVFVVDSKGYIGTGFNETSYLRNSFYAFDGGK